MVADEGSKQVMFAGREVPNNQSFLVDVIFFSVLKWTPVLGQWLDWSEGCFVVIDGADHDRQDETED